MTQRCPGQRSAGLCALPDRVFCHYIILFNKCYFICFQSYEVWLSAGLDRAQFWLSAVPDRAQLWLSAVPDSAQLWLSAVLDRAIYALTQRCPRQRSALTQRCLGQVTHHDRTGLTGLRWGPCPGPRRRPK